MLQPREMEARQPVALVSKFSGQRDLIMDFYVGTMEVSMVKACLHFPGHRRLVRW